MSGGTYFDLKGILSEIRSNYNCFDENEEPYYRALSDAIHLVSAQSEKRTEERTETHACDCISRKAAVEAFSNNGSFFVYGADVCKAIVSRIKQLPAAEPEPRWISCEEMLPEEKQDVLLLMPHNMVVGFWEDVLNDGGRTWYANSGDGYFTDMDVLNGYDDPIAWMPLPKPYGGEQDGSD